MKKTVEGAAYFALPMEDIAERCRAEMDPSEQHGKVVQPNQQSECRYRQQPERSLRLAIHARQARNTARAFVTTHAPCRPKIFCKRVGFRLVIMVAKSW